MMPFGGLNSMRQTDKNPSLSSPAGKILEADSFFKGVESPNMMEDKGNPHPDVHTLVEERKHLLSLKKGEVERQIQERVASQAFPNPTFQQHDSVSTKGSLGINNQLDDFDNSNLQAGRSNQASTVMGVNKPVNPDAINWSGFVTQNDTLKGPPLQVSAIQHELPFERRENIPSHFQNITNNNGGSRNQSSVLTSYSLKEHWKPVPATDSDPQGVTMLKDVNNMTKHVSMGEHHGIRTT